jgi:hypothetical protein
VVTLSDAANGYVIADAVRVEPYVVPPIQIVDNGNVGFSKVGNWPYSAGQGYGGDVHYSALGNGSDVARWTFTVTPGRYHVSASWFAHANRASNAPYTIFNGGTALGTVRVSQKVSANDFSDAGTSWEDLGGPYDITGNTLVVSLSDAANGYVIADAVRIERVATNPSGVTEFYVDPDYTGADRNGQAATPWTDLGANTSATWAAINSALESGDVAVYFSARRANTDTNQTWTGELDLRRTDPSNHRLILDGMSKYNTDDASPLWTNYSGSAKFEITGTYPISSYAIAGPQNNVTIRGFRVLSTGGQLIPYRGGSHVLIENNELSALPSANIGAGLMFGDLPGTTDLTIRNNIIHDTFGEAIYVGGNSYTYGAPTNLDGVLIEGNTIYNAGRYGGQGDCIDLKAALANVVVRNNVCHDSAASGNVNGITALSPLTAEGNVIYNMPDRGIIVGAGVIRDNIIFNTPVGIYTSDLPTIPVNTTITNNTVYGCSGASAGQVGIILGASNALSAFRVQNNIIMQCGTGMGGWTPSTGGMATYVITHNDLYANSTPYGSPFYRSDLFPTITTDNLSVDPLFQDIGNPAGADGRFRTGDDGFVPQQGVVCTGGVNNTFIGALSCTAPR